MTTLKYISMAVDGAVETAPCNMPFKEALKEKHTSQPARLCSMCGKVAVVDLAPHFLAKQTDGTTHVCHPVLGGCNHGFSNK